MNILELEQNLQNLTENLSKQDFIFDFLASYGVSKSTISRLRKKSDVNTLDTNGELVVKTKKIFFKIIEDATTFKTDSLLTLKKGMRFIIVTDFKCLTKINVIF